MLDLLEHLTAILLKKNMTLATAESCTGGLLGATITHKAGASKIYERGFITYANEAKTEMLDVPADIIAKYGAVSAPVAEAMARGALTRSKAGIAISITGIAGPDGGTEEKPVGLVYFGYALRNGQAGTFEHLFEGDRSEIRIATVTRALKHLIAILERKE